MPRPRITGASQPTILKLLRDLGEPCAAFHDEHVRGLKPERVQTNEIWSFNYCKQKNIEAVKAGPSHAWDVWIWTALDSDSKLIIAYRVGLRTQENADEFMLDLAGRIVSRVRLTSDGHGTYLPAVENAHSLADVDYAQIVKRRDLTIRTQMRRFSRLTNDRSKKLENHACSIAMFFMCYNYCRVHSTIGTSPAVASGLVDRVWTIEELLGLLD